MVGSLVVTATWDQGKFKSETMERELGMQLSMEHSLSVLQCLGSTLL